MNMKKILSATVCCGAAALSAAEGRFTLQSPDLRHGFASNHLLSASYGFGCDGGNTSPALTWRNPPAGTKSYVLTVYDPDAPTGIGWTHWVVANIPAATRSLPAAITPEGQGLPEGALQTRNDIGVPGYMGAGPLHLQAHGIKNRQVAECGRQCHTGAGRLLYAGQRIGRSEIHRTLRPLKPRHPHHPSRFCFPPCIRRWGMPRYVPEQRFPTAVFFCPRTAVGRNPKRCRNRAVKRDALS